LTNLGFLNFVKVYLTFERAILKIEEEFEKEDCGILSKLVMISIFKKGNGFLKYEICAT